MLTEPVVASFSVSLCLTRLSFVIHSYYYYFLRSGSHLLGVLCTACLSVSPFFRLDFFQKLYLFIFFHHQIDTRCFPTTPQF